VLLAALPASAGAPGVEVLWEDGGVREGVHVFQRENAALQAREVRAVADMDVSSSEVIAVVMDYTNYPEFLPGLMELRRIDDSHEGVAELYMRYRPRFVVIQARDVVLRVTVSTPPPGSADPWRADWEAEPDRLPEVPSTVRMPLNTGHWTVESLDGGARSRVTYQVAVKPGGSIPDWLVRWGAARALPELMHVVESRVKAVRPAHMTTVK
jgi:hypothetical protein